jgi:hypothetical protein
MRGYVFEIRILLLGAERDDALVRFNAGEPIHGGAVFEADGRAGAACQVDNFLDASATETAGHEDSLERAFRAQSFSYRMKTNEDGQTRLSLVG